MSERFYCNIGLMGLMTGFLQNNEELTLENNNSRQLLYTGQNIQLLANQFGELKFTHEVIPCGMLNSLI